jgi:hypothetical protein
MMTKDLNERVSAKEISEYFAQNFDGKEKKLGFFKEIIKQEK